VRLGHGGLDQGEQVVATMDANDGHELVDERHEVEPVVHERAEGETVLTQPNLPRAELPQVAILADQAQDEGVHRCSEFEDALPRKRDATDGDALGRVAWRHDCVGSARRSRAALPGPVSSAVLGSRPAADSASAGRVVAAVAVDLAQSLAALLAGSTVVSGIRNVSRK
jgi:hypothetical protein